MLDKVRLRLAQRFAQSHTARLCLELKTSNSQSAFFLPYHVSTVFVSIRLLSWNVSAADSAQVSSPASVHVAQAAGRSAWVFWGAAWCQPPRNCLTTAQWWGAQWWGGVEWNSLWVLRSSSLLRAWYWQILFLWEQWILNSVPDLCQVKQKGKCSSWEETLLVHHPAFLSCWTHFIVNWHALAYTYCCDLIEICLLNSRDF